MKKILPLLLIVVVAFLAACGGGGGGNATSAATSPIPPAAPAYKNEMLLAANRLVATQKNDGGWEWMYPTTDPTAGGPTPLNTLGVTAMGVLNAYKLTGNVIYLNACKSTYNNGLLARQTGRIKGTDITFLVSLSNVTGDSTYANFAKTRYAETLGLLPSYGGYAATAAGLAQYLQSQVPAAPADAAWNINLYVQGLTLLNAYFPGQSFGTDATTMAAAIYNLCYAPSPVFVISNTSQTDYWLYFTSAVEAFTVTGQYLSQRDSLMTQLIASQQADGHFAGVGGGSDIQTTSYAVMALAKNNQKTAVANAVKFLINAQDINPGNATYGGWVDPTSTPVGECTEVDSEAIEAIYNYI